MVLVGVVCVCCLCVPPYPLIAQVHNGKRRVHPRRGQTAVFTFVSWFGDAHMSSLMGGRSVWDQGCIPFLITRFGSSVIVL